MLYADYDGYAIKPHPGYAPQGAHHAALYAGGRQPEGFGHQRLRAFAGGAVGPEDITAWPWTRPLPFLPNTGVAFVVIDWKYNMFKTSWHGRDEIRVANDKPRHTILNAYYAEPVKEAAY